MRICYLRKLVPLVRTIISQLTHRGRWLEESTQLAKVLFLIDRRLSSVLAKERLQTKCITKLNFQSLTPNEMKDKWIWANLIFLSFSSKACSTPNLQAPRGIPTPQKSAHRLSSNRAIAMIQVRESVDQRFRQGPNFHCSSTKVHHLLTRIENW